MIGDAGNLTGKVKSSNEGETPKSSVEVCCRPTVSSPVKTRCAAPRSSMVPVIVAMVRKTRLALLNAAGLLQLTKAL